MAGQMSAWHWALAGSSAVLSGSEAAPGQIDKQQPLCLWTPLPICRGTGSDSPHLPCSEMRRWSCAAQGSPEAHAGYLRSLRLEFRRPTPIVVINNQYRVLYEQCPPAITQL